jgi:DNA-binding LacI/PurR family transcriptional regulator
VHADELAESGSPLTGIRAVEGFRCGLTRHLRPYLPSHVLRSHYRAEEAPALAQAILGLSPRPDVLIVDGTEMASALAATLSEPMPVLGIGPAVSSPAVAVIEHPTAEVGRRAAEMLLARLERPDAAAEHVFIPIDADRARAAVFAAFERFTGQRACV